MLIPQYTIRWLLGATVACAAVSSVVALGLHGSRWAMAVSLAIGALAVVLMLHVLLFGLIWIASRGGRPERKQRASGRTPRWPSILLACGAAWASCAQAANGVSHRLAGYGLKLDVEVPWLEGGGYRPAMITITPTARVVADRTLTIEFHQGWRWDTEPSELCVVQEIEIPAGSGPIHTTCSLPKWEQQWMYAITVKEDGEKLPKLCVPPTSPASNVGWAPQAHAFPTILVLGTTLPDTTKLASLLPVKEYYESRPRPPTTAASAAVSYPLPSLVGLPVAGFPERWIDYTSLDIVYLTLDEFGQLARQKPAACRALLAWVASGGNLWVAGAGRDWQRLSELERLAGFPPPAAPAGRGQAPGWREPDLTQFGQPFRNYYPDLNDGPPGARFPSARPEPGDALSDASSAGLPAKPPPRPFFLLRALGLGQVLALSADPFPGRKADWSWVLNTVGAERWLWTHRHGLSNSDENRDFWKFLIPGIGLAPVTSFYVLITLFVIAIGPVNYWLLRRWRRLHLLLLTIPLGALLVGLTLFAYALLSDGLGTRVRVRSVTWIDQHRGQAVSWARLSYYAGLAPAHGLQFPADVAVLPLEHDPPNMFYRRRFERRMLVWDEDQRFTTGWLPARMPTQYVTVRSRPTPSGLLLVGGTAASPPKIENRLGTRLTQLVVRTADGQYYRAQEVEAGATAVIQPLAAEAATGLLRPWYRENQPRLPVGDDLSAYTTSRSRYNFYYPNQGPPPSPDTSRLELTLALCDRVGDANGRGLRPGCYLALVASDPEVLLGVPGAREEASFHVICGEW